MVRIPVRRRLDGAHKSAELRPLDVVEEQRQP